MSVSIPSELSNITLAHLNFTNNCTNAGVGYTVWSNDFWNSTQTPGNDTTGKTDDGPEGYEDWWTNGTSPEFIGFWRASLSSVLPKNYTTYTDAQIAAWTNHTEFYDFFNDDAGDDQWPWPGDLGELSNWLSEGGGCTVNQTQGAQTQITDYVSFEEACMIQYCCSPSITTDDESSTNPYPYYTNWTIQDACAFDTCSRTNKGNPDLGGIGVIVAYFIELSLLSLSLVSFGIKLITDWHFDKPGKVKPQLLHQHEAAMVAGTGVFLDNAVFFSFAVNFASIIFNYRDEPLLYDDKLGQTSSLLAIDAPITLLLMGYKVVDRKKLRITIVMLDALMTFIIQFLFRRAQSFSPGTSLCFAWDDYVQGIFLQRFEAKAVWAVLVLLFVLWSFADRIIALFSACGRRSRRAKAEKPAGGMVYRLEKLKRSKVAAFFAKAYHILQWRLLIAYILATYGLFAIIIDIRFVLFLRHQEKDISTSGYDEDTWGYGQILAVFVWVPVFVEYIYIYGFQRHFWGSADRNAREIREERNSYEEPTREATPLGTGRSEYEMVEHTDYADHKDDMIAHGS